MSFADSQPVLEDRAKAAGLSEDIVQAVVDEGFNSLSKFAFSSSYVPGSGDDTAFTKTIRAVLKRDATLGEMASFRKLLHEAYSVVTQEMKQQLERSEEVQVRRLTQPERADMYQKQVKRLSGLNLRGPLEPSDALVDVYAAMYEQNRVRFIPWEKYTSKETELDKELEASHLFALDGSGCLKMEKKRAEPVADTSSEILLQHALQRRGLSLDQTNLLNYNLHQKWVDKLIRVRLQLPPPGYQKPTFRQLLEADKKLFEELANSTRAGVQTTPKGRPLDLCFDECCNMPEVLHLLQPLMGKVGDAKPSDDKKSASSARPGPYAGGTYGKSRGKGKNKNKSSSARIPATLLEGGCRATTNKGDPICFGYNLGSCSLTVTNGRCEKGYHVCALPKCGKHHPYVQCPHGKGGS